MRRADRGAAQQDRPLVVSDGHVGRKGERAGGEGRAGLVVEGDAVAGDVRLARCVRLELDEGGIGAAAPDEDLADLDEVKAADGPGGRRRERQRGEGE